MPEAQPRIAFLGLGLMGSRQVRRLLSAGYDVTVWNRTRAKAEALIEHGCAVADTIGDLRGHDVVFTIVSTPADLEQVLTDEGGLLADPAQVPGCVVDCSTVSTESSAVATLCGTQSQRITWWWGGWGSNPRPRDYESHALTG